MSEKKKIEIQTDEPENTENNNDTNSDNQGKGSVANDESGGKDAAKVSESPGEQSRETTEDKLARLEQEVQANYDRFLRVSADFDNYKKRTAREMSDLRKYANEAMLTDLLSVVDNLERAIASGKQKDASVKSLLEGVEMTLKDVLRVLDKHGVKPFDSEGKPFDPTYHQAMMREETEQYPDNTVLNEFQKGYMIHDRLLRPAMVVVSKVPSETGSQGENNN